MMLRKILLASAALIIGYVVGVRAGFSAAVRDYLENDAQLLKKRAAQDDRFDYSETDMKRTVVNNAAQASDEAESDESSRTFY